MDFPLIPSRSSQFPFREKSDFLPQTTQELSPAARTPSARPLLVKDSSLGTTRYIDVEYREITDQMDQFLRWPDFRLRNAFTQYYYTAQKKPRHLHTVNLYA
jgi:hypothetical protein